MNTRRRATLAALLLTATLPLTACAGPDAPVEQAAPAASAPAEETTPPVEEVDAAAPGSRVYAFGETVDYATSATPYTVTLSQPRPFTPSESAAGEPGAGGAIVFDITVTNTGTAPLDVTLVWPTASSGGAEAEGIYDSEQDVNAPPSTPVLPGNSITYPSAWGIADAADLTVRVPGADYADPEAIYSLTDATP